MPSSSRPKRVYRRDWKLHTRVRLYYCLYRGWIVPLDSCLYLQSVRGSVSLPRLHLISSSRPLFECPTCFSYNDRLPICLWCKRTTIESAAAFWASMPKQRTVSAPMKFTWSYVARRPTTREPRRTSSTEVRD